MYYFLIQKFHFKEFTALKDPSLQHCSNQEKWGEPLRNPKVASVNAIYAYNEVLYSCIQIEAALKMLTENNGITYF